MNTKHMTLIAFLMFVFLCAYLVFLASHCGGPQITDDDPDDCDAACGNMLELGCDASVGSPGVDEIWGTQDDISCVEMCIGIVGENGSLQLECTIDAQSCAEINICFE